MELVVDSLLCETSPSFTWRLARGVETRQRALELLKIMSCSDLRMLLLQELKWSHQSLSISTVFRAVILQAQCREGCHGDSLKDVTDLWGCQEHHLYLNSMATTPELYFYT